MFVDNLSIRQLIGEYKKCSPPSKYYSLIKDEMVRRNIILEKEDKIVFHGACHGCTSPYTHGVARCNGCQNFRAIWSLPDLHTEETNSALEQRVTALENSVKQLQLQLKNK